MATPVEYLPSPMVRTRRRRGRPTRAMRLAARRAIDRSRGAAPSINLMTSAIEGVGQISPWELSSPSVALWRRAMAGRQQRGMGQNGEALAFGLTAGMLAAVIVIAGVVNYQLGKAMAPDKASEPKWAWGNAIGGTLFPPFTLGMAVYKNYIR